MFYLVANALIYRRYVVLSSKPPLHVLLFLLFLTTLSIGFSLSWKFDQRLLDLPLFGGSLITITAIFHYMVPLTRSGLEWSVPLMPWPAALSIFLNVFLMTTLKILSFKRFGIWTVLLVLFYVLYGVHSTYRAEEMETETEMGNESVEENRLSTNNHNPETKIDNLI